MRSYGFNLSFQNISSITDTYKQTTDNQEATTAASFSFVGKLKRREI